ncbi:MAG: glycosyltransferase family protein [Granulosicoccus sp.]
MSEYAAPRVLFYVQHLLGIGHLMRSMRICEALYEADAHVTLVTGGMPVKGVPPEGVHHVQLNPIAVRNGDFSAIVDSAGNDIDDTFKSERCSHLLSVYQNIQPDLVVLEAFPFGRRQLRFELLPLLESIAQSESKPVVVSSIRDVLQRSTKAGRDDYVLDLIHRHFDGVMVHGDPEFSTLSDSFPRAHEFDEKIVYTGLVCAKPVDEITESFDIVVSAGGGAVGADLLMAAVEAAKLLPKSLSWCVITGPNSPMIRHFDSMAATLPNVHFESFRSDFPNVLKSAQMSVSQSGYNTVSDILKAKCRCLLVPYSAAGETEQLDRARRLETLGIARVLYNEELSGAAMAASISESLREARPSGELMLNTEGAAQSAQILLNLIADKH